MDIRSERNVFADAVSRSETEVTRRLIIDWLRDNIPEGVPASPVPGVPTRAKGKLRQFLVELTQCLASGHPSVRLVDLACSV